MAGGSLCLTPIIGALLLVIALASDDELEFKRILRAENKRLQQACGNYDFPSPATAPPGGDASGKSHYPWAVFITMNERLECAGVIISSRHILSARYCVE